MRWSGVNVSKPVPYISVLLFTFRNNFIKKKFTVEHGYNKVLGQPILISYKQTKHLKIHIKTLGLMKLF